VAVIGGGLISINGGSEKAASLQLEFERRPTARATRMFNPAKLARRLRGVLIVIYAYPFVAKNILWPTDFSIEIFGQPRF
jgi:hypothetical protein